MLSAAATVSSPQQTFACRRRLPVDFASPVSRNRRTDLLLQRQLLAAHSNTWALRPLVYSTIGMGLKNTYIGASQSLLSRSDNQLVAGPQNSIPRSPSSSSSSSTTSTFSSSLSLTSIGSRLDSCDSSLLSSAPGWVQGGEGDAPLWSFPFLLFRGPVE